MRLKRASVCLGVSVTIYLPDSVATRASLDSRFKEVKIQDASLLATRNPSSLLRLTVV